MCNTLKVLYSKSIYLRGSRLHLKPNRCTAQIIDGQSVAESIRAQVRKDIMSWMDVGNRKPSLVAVLVGGDPASITYVQKKMDAAREVGISSKTLGLDSSISESELISKVQELNNDDDIDGILVQLPLPPHISERNVCNAVTPTKDVDGFHIMNMGKLCLNMDTFVPCTVLAVLELMNNVGMGVFGKNIVVCGRSKNIGLPLSLILHSDARNELAGLESTVTICHRNTPPEQLEIFTKNADVIISSTGVVGLIKPHMVKSGALVIDVGTTRIKLPSGKTKLVGDVDFDGVSNIAGYITPVPGGVGPVTVAMLMKNTLKAAKSRTKTD